MSIVTISINVIVNRSGFSGRKRAIAIKEGRAKDGGKDRFLVVNDKGKIEEVDIDEVTVE